MNPDEVRAALQSGQISAEEAERIMTLFFQEASPEFDSTEQARKFVQDNLPTAPRNKLLTPNLLEGSETEDEGGIPSFNELVNSLTEDNPTWTPEEVRRAATILLGGDTNQGLIDRASEAFPDRPTNIEPERLPPDPFDPFNLDDPFNTGGDGSNVSLDQVLLTPDQELSQSRSGRNTIFQRNLAQNPEFSSANAATQRSFQTGGDPLSAQFALGQLRNLGLVDDPGQGDFTQFLQGSPGIQGRQDFLDQIGGLRNIFEPSDDPTGGEAFRRLKQRERLNQDETGNNIIRSAFETGLNPFFRGRSNALNTIFTRAEAENPNDSIFRIFLEQGLGGLGGPTGFGG